MLKKLQVIIHKSNTIAFVVYTAFKYFLLYVSDFLKHQIEMKKITLSFADRYQSFILNSELHGQSWLEHSWPIGKETLEKIQFLVELSI